VGVGISKLIDFVLYFHDNKGSLKNNFTFFTPLQFAEISAAHWLSLLP